MFDECLKSVSRIFWKLFQDLFKGGWGMFLGCFEAVSGRVGGVFRVFHGCVKVFAGKF